jgi:hypothetical protein
MITQSRSQQDTKQHHNNDVGFRAYIPRYAIITKTVIKDMPEEMDLNILVRQLNNDNNNKHLHQQQIVDAYGLRIKVRAKDERSEGR